MHHRTTKRLSIIIAGGSIAAALWIGKSDWLRVAVAQEPAKTKTAQKQPLILDRPPVRRIYDPNPVFSGIAVDTERDEVFITNDSEASPSISVFPTQFQSTESIIEPRRRIAGPKSRMELPCGIALSPEFQEMYASTGDGQNLHVYPMGATGDVAPIRMLEVPHDTSNVFLDRKHDELFLATQHANRLAVYKRTAQGEEEPLRVIQGGKTELADPHGIYVDTERDEVFVANHGHWHLTKPGEGHALWGNGKLAFERGSFSHAGTVWPLEPSPAKFLPPSITVFARTANGDVAPIRVIQGSQTQLALPLGIFMDSRTGELVVANTGDESVVFFDRNANGDVAPTRVIKGPATNLKGPTGVTIDTKHNELWVTSWENHATNVYPRTAQGNVAPLRVIRSAPKGAPLATIGRLGGIAYDPKRKQILAPN